MSSDTQPNRPARDDDTRQSEKHQTRPYTPIKGDTQPPQRPVESAQLQVSDAEPVAGDATADDTHLRPPAPYAANTLGQPPRARRGAPTASGYRPRPERRQASSDAADSALYLPWWSLVLMLFGVLIIAGGIVGSIYLLGSGTQTSRLVEPTAIIRIITAEPRTQSDLQSQPPANAPATEIIAGGNAPSDIVLEGPTLPAVEFTTAPVAIRVDSRVRVEGVGDQQLNVRDAASVTGSTVRFRADEGTLFRVMAGPQQADGFTWWQIQSLTDPAQQGWAVSNYLRAAPE